MTLGQEAAETVGIRALGWLVGNEELLPVFLGATGASENDLRASAADPAFLGAVLDFVLMDDAWVIGCADALAIAPENLPAARLALPGADQMNWT